MRCGGFRATLLSLALAACAPAALAQTTATLEAQADDPATAQVEQTLRAAIPEIEAFFGRPFAEPVRLVLARDRAAFNAAFPAGWGMGETQCWMVGVGVADFLALLSPTAWGAEACDHRGDAAEVREILTHELVHTYHGQRHPTRDFTGAEDAGWFVEGLAVLVSGQLTEARMTAVRGAAARGEGPASLSAAWEGRQRYGQAGSLARYLDETYGRERLFDLLTARDTADILRRLDVTEARLLQDWRAWLTG